VAKVDLFNISGDKIGDIDLNDAVFGLEPNKHVMYEYVKNYLANQRQGTQSAKTRAEVRGGGRKPFKQKGTGNARQGTIRAPHFVGGGVVFAPKPRDYSYKIPKKVKRLAFKCALSSKVLSNDVIVIDSLELSAGKTKEMIQVLANLKTKNTSVVVTGEKNDNMVFAANNIKGVTPSYVGELNAYQVLRAKTLVMTVDAVKKIEEVYA
jgi:large subunit ribosomal protein L4